MQEESPLTFPKKVDKDRIARYAHYALLYSGDHFEAFSIKGEKDFSTQYNRLRYVVGNFAGLITRMMADMLFGETVNVDMQDKQNQLFVDALFEDNQLLTQLYESEIISSSRGDTVFKMRVGQRNPEIVGSPAEIIIEEIPPSIYFPVLDRVASRYTPKRDVIATIFEQNGNCYLHKEMHSPGYIFNEVYLYDKDSGKILSPMEPEQFGYKKMEETGVERSLIFHIPNVRDGSGYFGTSDYKDLESLMFALNNRLTKVDNILDKHSDPILAVPPGVLDEEGNVRKSALGLVEVDGEGGKPEYIVWNANLQSAMDEVDKLIELLFLFSEASPAGTPIDKGGVAESGRALKFKLLSTVRKRNRKIRYYDQAIKDMIETSIELALANGIKMGDVAPTSAERPKLKWGDGIINDEVEQTDIEVARVDNGLSSRADAISKLDDISPEEAQKKVVEIDKESEPKTVPTVAPSATTPFTPPVPGPVKTTANAPSGV